MILRCQRCNVHYVLRWTWSFSAANTTVAALNLKRKYGSCNNVNSMPVPVTGNPLKRIHSVGLTHQ